MNTVDIILNLTSIALLLFGIYASIISRKELQYRAQNKFLLFSVVSAISVFAIQFLGIQILSLTIIGLIYLPIFIFTILISLPNKSKELSFKYTRQALNRIDERDIMFSRSELRHNKENYDAYYKRKPELKELDDKMRSNPGLMKEGTYFYHKEIFEKTAKTFDLIDLLHPDVDGEVNSQKTERSASQATHHFIQKTKNLGALSAGVCELNDTHYYSHGGRGKRYNATYHKEHEYALVFTVEMDHTNMMYAPQAPTVLESANQYYNSGNIAIQIAKEIRDAGYETRAHIDGNYKVIAPLIASDAGLGEIGRMGILMTPIVGPRVRIGVITTNMPLSATEVNPDNSTLEFCLACKKCATNCPSQAISFNPPEDINGAYRWQINQEACFEYWTKSGTDCGKCMIVCPYSHPNNLLHNVVRKGISSSSSFRKFALWADDYIYGKKPKTAKLDSFKIN